MKEIIIVSGIPRSGTSMMMQVLEKSSLACVTDHARRADPDNKKGYYELEAVKGLAEDTAWLADAGGKVIKVIYKLLTKLPSDWPYRVVFMERDLKAVVASQNSMLKRQHKASAVEDERLISIFAKELEKTKRWFSEQVNFDVIYIDFRKTLLNTEHEIDKIASFLGIEVNQAMISAVDPRLATQ